MMRDRSPALGQLLLRAPGPILPTAARGAEVRSQARVSLSWPPSAEHGILCQVGAASCLVHTGNVLHLQRYTILVRMLLINVGLESVSGDQNSNEITL